MQFMIIPVLITSLIALLRGGRVQNLARLHLKNSWIPLTMATLQFFIVLFPQWRGELFLRLRPSLPMRCSSPSLLLIVNCQG